MERLLQSVISAWAEGTAALGWVTVGPKENCSPEKLVKPSRAEPCPKGEVCRSKFIITSSVAPLPAGLDTLGSSSFSIFFLGSLVVFLLLGLLVWVFSPSSFSRLCARVHLGISLLLNELLVWEGGSEVPSGLGGNGGGGWGNVLFHMQSTLN